MEGVMAKDVVILGIFVADTTYRASRLPKMGETLLGEHFHLTPGGKGSNQAVAAAQAGATTHFITKLGHDNFAEMALALWQDKGVTPAVTQHQDSYTGAAFVFIEADSGNNAIIVSPGVASTISPDDLVQHTALIESASVFITQLEQPIDTAFQALTIARQAGVKTLLNPAPAASLPKDMLALCDFVTPNETESEGLTGIPVTSIDSARMAADALLAQGAGTALITLGEHGALLHDASQSVHIPAIHSGAVVETTGAGDAFNGGFAAAIAEGMSALDAAWFGTAASSISVTRAGTAASMPSREDILAVLATHRP